MQICPNCGEENPDRFRLCGFCGTSLAPEVPVEEVRRTVSIVFSDLKGSTALGERLDSEHLREVLNVYFNEMRLVLERHGGRVEKYIGDAIMAVFGLPRVHEDDALRAVRAAFEMKERLVDVNELLEANYGVRLENRTGVNTGEVVAGDVSSGQRLVTGDTVNTAARLEQNAPACEILIGASTYQLVRDAVSVDEVEPLELKGKSGSCPRLSPPRGFGPRRRLLAPARPSDRRQRRRALDARAHARACDRARPLPHRDDLRSGRRRKISAHTRIPRSREPPCHHAHGTVPVLRRGHHVLAHRRDACARPQASWRAMRSNKPGPSSVPCFLITSM